MSDTSRMVECVVCGAELEVSADEVVAERRPCPHCGGTSRLTKIHLESKMTMRTMLAGKAKPAAGKWFMAFKTGEELFRKTGRWHRLERVLDRRNNRYFEHIEDADTGETIRQIEEPLTEHKGRGSARFKRKR